MKFQIIILIKSYLNKPIYQTNSLLACLDWLEQSYIYCIPDSSVVMRQRLISIGWTGTVWDMSNCSCPTMFQLGQLSIGHVPHQKFSYRTVCTMSKGPCPKFKKKIFWSIFFLVFLLSKYWWLISLLKKLKFFVAL